MTDDPSSPVRRAATGGDVTRTDWPGRNEPRVNLYQGSGRAGACFDEAGLMNHQDERAGDRIGRTVLMHADHWHRDEATGMDYWLPLGRLRWIGGLPEPTAEYRQHLSLYDATLETSLSWTDASIDLRSYFHPEERDLLAVEIDYEGGERTDDVVPPVALTPDLEPRMPMHDLSLSGEFEELAFDSIDREGGGTWLARVRAGTAESVLGLSVASRTGKLELHSTADGVKLTFSGEQGSHFLLVGMAGAEREDDLRTGLEATRSPDDFFASAKRAWHERWGDSALEVPIPEYQALWARSLYYVFASYAPEVRSPAAPHGWSGHGWGFHFPQDVSYVHPALLRHGHFDVARAWVEFYRDRLEETRAQTRRVFDAAGTMWEWEYPIGAPHDRPHPNAEYPFERFHFEIHNAAYPARMARETAQYVEDEEWSREVAWPVVRGSARFFADVLEREDDGTWGIDHEPSMGQDELGGQNAKNYLCALFGARYALEAAVAMVEEFEIKVVDVVETDGESAIAETAVGAAELDRWRTVLEDGLAFDRLLTDAGYYLPNEDVTREEVEANQKHPVQLNPLTFLPQEIDEASVAAYERRDDLCAGMGEGKSMGWTLAAYALAASHRGDADGLIRELERVVPSDYADPDWIQVYETAGARDRPYYITSHGLYLQALSDAVVSDYFGEVEVGAAWPDEWGEVAFENLHTVDGVRSGEYREDEWRVTRTER